MSSGKISIKIEKTYDPLTTGSYEHPEAPWVGINPREPSDVSPAIARLERLIREYVNRGVASCTVLIGGDRGSGKTSLVKKVIERVRRPPDNEVADRSEDKLQAAKRRPQHDYWTFPRPVLVRVHGRRCLDFDPNLKLKSDEPVKLALRQIAEAVHRALIDEFGRMFPSLAEGGTAEEQEQASHFKMELDQGPYPARLREMWTLFSDDGRPTPKLPRPKDREAGRVPVDQALRELVAMASSIQLVWEIRRHQDQEEDKPRRVLDEERRNREDMSFWKEFARQMLDGGRLVNPLAGFMVAALIFIAVLRADVNIPIAIVIALLSGIATTVLLNYATARRNSNALLADPGLAAIDRTLPLVLRRMEHAGLFPIIVIDEFDKLEGEDHFETKMNRLIRNLKYFFADQAFVCFLVGRQYYERILERSTGDAEKRDHVDTFFADRILVSHQPETLLAYLDQLMPEPSSPPAADEHLTRTFLKHLYLYRAKGHLADLQETIASEHELDYTVALGGGKKFSKWRNTRTRFSIS